MEKRVGPPLELNTDSRHARRRSRAQNSPVDNRLFTLGIYLLNKGKSAKLQILRDDKKIDLEVPIFESRTEPGKLSEMADPKSELLPRLGVVALTITPEVAAILGELHIPSGIVITSIVDNRLAVDSGLTEGDIVQTEAWGSSRPPG
jgi:hypothetical protein